jgi:hypothetical protein
MRRLWICNIESVKPELNFFQNNVPTALQSPESRWGDPSHILARTQIQSRVGHCFLKIIGCDDLISGSFLDRQGLIGVDVTAESTFSAWPRDFKLDNLICLSKPERQRQFTLGTIAGAAFDHIPEFSLACQSESHFRADSVAVRSAPTVFIRRRLF